MEVESSEKNEVVDEEGFAEIRLDPSKFEAGIAKIMNHDPADDSSDYLDSDDLESETEEYFSGMVHISYC